LVGIAVMEMKIEDLGGGVTNLVLHGRLGTLGAGEIDFPFSAVAGAKRAIVVDISQVDFITSLGVRLLLNGARAVEKNGGKLVLLSPNENVHSVLRIAGIEQLIPVIFDRLAAVAAVMGNADR
jgi:anti-sigma B factor antagonist